MRRQHAENVFGSKIEAKQDIAAMLWPTIGATALYLLPMGLLSAALAAVCGGVDTGEISKIPMERLLIYVGIYLLAHLFIIQPLYYGLTQFYALRRAGARPAVSTVTIALSSLRLYCRSIRLSLTIILFSVLWAIPAAGVCVISLLGYQYVIPNNFGWFLCIEVMLVTAAGYACMVLRYHCAYALITEQPMIGCWKAVRLAAQKFRGHKSELFSLIISFIFLFMIAVLFSGIILIILCPYFLLSLYHLFDRVRGVQIQAFKSEK